MAVLKLQNFPEGHHVLTLQNKFQNHLHSVLNSKPSQLDPSNESLAIEKLMEETITYYETRFQSSFDVSAVREFVTDKAHAFMKTASFEQMKEDEKLKFMGLFIELCVSYKSERNPGWGYASTGRSAVWNLDTHGVRSDTLKMIDEMCSGSIKIVFGEPPQDVLIKAADDKTHNCVFYGEKGEMQKLFDDTGVMAYAIPDFKNKKGGTIYLGKRMVYNGADNNNDASLLSHEILHILDLQGRSTTKDCINTIVSEYNSYKYQYIQYYGDMHGALAAKDLGNFLQSDFIDKKSIYNLEYNNLSEPEKLAFQAIIKDLKAGYLVPTAEFESRVRG